MLAYEEAIKCPRCGREALTRTEEQEDDKGIRMAVSRCGERSCSYYGKVWFFALDRDNTAIYHTIYNT